MSRYPRLLQGMLTCALMTTPAFSADGTDFFERKIRPILVEHCYECHSADSEDVGGSLLVDSQDGLRSGGESGPAVVPKNTKKSLLLSAIEYRDMEMPPDKKLHDDVISDFRKWIRMGAPDPRTDEPTRPELAAANSQPTNLWSLEPIELPEIPLVVDTAWSSDVIDIHVLRKLEAAGLKPSPPANPQTLLRRICFDLTGLPPTADDSSDTSDAGSFSAVVDRLLDAPQFGERWGRHWLDVVRYGESTGSSRDVLMLHSWRYRDYVIDAFNNDLPYDQFIREQVSGDLLNSESEDERRRKLIATGMLAIGSKSLNGGNLALDIVDDQIDVVGKAVLGLTVSCARCHDHKFDPVPTADYYALAGIFRNTKTFYGGNTKRPKSIRDELKVYLPLSEDLESSADAVTSMEKKLSAVRKKQALLQKRLATAKKRVPKAGTDDAAKSATIQAVKAYESLKTQVADLESEQEGLRKELQSMPAREYAFAVLEGDKPRDWPVQVRGDAKNNGPVVPRGFLSCVELPGQFEIPQNASGRRQLADWLADPNHPLTPRVMVNRIWQHLFGRGLVESVNNFGISGSQPTHPELLDYLAHRFVHHHHWSVKAMVREIVLTKTYQMSSHNNPKGWNQNPANTLLWRANRRQLEAEAIRDAILTASGQLNLSRPSGSLVQQIGEGEVGRNINTAPLDEPFLHRSVYLPIIRGLLPEVLKVFDFPEPSNPSGQRTVTNVPTQSLFLLNSPFVTDQAAAIATRVKNSGSDPTERARYAWQICFSRQPTNPEVTSALAFIEQLKSYEDKKTDPWAMLCQSLVASAEFRFID